MGLGDLYGVALTLVLVGIVFGAGVLVLQNFQDATGISGTPAATTINSTQNAVSSLATTWLPVIVVIVAAAIILGLVLRSFGRGR
tara:strand:- start:78 stop:332 length:255 start_codon:yes stop_codon:yes gene_type:complete